MTSLAYRIVERMPGAELAAEDARAVAQIISWERQPAFAVPGRTAWYVLRTPIREPGGTRIFKAVKLKGVGAWNPVDSDIPSAITGDYPPGVSRPSTCEYADTANTSHFGVSEDGEFAAKYSEAAPFGAIVLRRALQEFENARTLGQARVPAIFPYSVLSYLDAGDFRGEPLGVVVSLVPDPSPYSLEWLLLGSTGATTEQLSDSESAVRSLGGNMSRFDQRENLALLCKVARNVASLLRQLARAGLYRYSAGWDNFYLDRERGEVFLTDLDSTRKLSELQPEVQGIQVMRDMAGALYRFANKLYHPNNLYKFHLRPVIEANPLGEMVSSYFDIDLMRGRALAAPLWKYFLPHWFLLKRHGRDLLSSWPDLQVKSYKMDKHLFHGLAIYSLAETYHSERARLGLPVAPSVRELKERVMRFLGERGDLVASFCDQQSAPAT